MFPGKPRGSLGEPWGHRKSTSFVIRPGFDPGSTPLVLKLPEPPPHLRVGHTRSTVSPRGSRAAWSCASRSGLETAGHRGQVPGTCRPAAQHRPAAPPPLSVLARESQVDQRATPSQACPRSVCVGGVSGGSLGGEPRAQGGRDHAGDGDGQPGHWAGAAGTRRALRVPVLCGPWVSAGMPSSSAPPRAFGKERVVPQPRAARGRRRALTYWCSVLTASAPAPAPA